MNRTASPVAVVTRFIEDVINGGKFDLVEELWAKDTAWHGGSLGEFHGLEEWKVQATPVINCTDVRMR